MGTSYAGDESVHVTAGEKRPSPLAAPACTEVQFGEEEAPEHIAVPVVDVAFVVAVAAAAAGCSTALALSFAAAGFSTSLVFSSVVVAAAGELASTFAVRDKGALLGFPGHWIAFA